MIEPGKLLAQIDNPNDLKKLDKSEMVQLSDELRDFIVDNVSDIFVLELPASV